MRRYLGLALAAEAFSVPVGFGALVIGPRRVAAFAALILSAAYFLYFTGMIFMFFASRR